MTLLRAALGAGLALIVATGAGAAELVLVFPGLKDKGSVAWALYGDEVSWSKRRGSVRADTTKVAGGQVQVTLDVPPGRYAVMAYHDVNGDGRLNTIPLGPPTEPYGFSNGARGAFGPPGWNGGAFVLEPAGGRQAIALR